MNDIQAFAQSRLAALDIGGRRIGIAVCDAMHITVTPLQTIERQTGYLEKIIAVLLREQVPAVIIGMPVAANGQITPVMQMIQEFAAELTEKWTGQVFFHDEFMSSKTAVQVLVQNGTKRSKRREKGNIDKTAAAIILRSFLDENF
jgi:putative Holliday junction resolvase